MRNPTLRPLTAVLTAAAIVALAGPVSLAAAAGTVEGYLVHDDGRRADGWSAVLVDESGAVRHTALVGDDGTYSLTGIERGTYSLALKSPDGAYAPVASEPIELGSRSLLRRDLAVRPATEQAVQSATVDYGLAIWWVGLTKRAKVLTTLGVVIGGGTLLWLLLEDDNPRIGSPISPPMGGGS